MCVYGVCVVCCVCGVYVCVCYVRMREGTRAVEENTAQRPGVKAPPTPPSSPAISSIQGGGAGGAFFLGPFPVSLSLSPPSPPSAPCPLFS